MKRKGFYSALIAFIALGVVIGTLFYAKAPLNEDKVKYRMKGVEETAAMWANSRYLYDKTMAEAMADLLYAKIVAVGSCGVDLSGITLVVTNYFASIEAYLQSNTGFTCTTTQQFGSVSGLQLEGHFSLDCDKVNQNISIGKGFDINKTATILTDVPAVGQCTIIITDDQSGLDDLSMVATYS